MQCMLLRWFFLFQLVDKAAQGPEVFLSPLHSRGRDSHASLFAQKGIVERKIYPWVVQGKVVGRGLLQRNQSDAWRWAN